MVRRAQPRRPRARGAVALPRRRGQRPRRGRPLAPEDGRSQAPAQAAGQGRQAGALPRLRGRAGHRRAAQDRPLRRLPAHLRRGDVRGAAHLAAGRRARGRACRHTSSSPTPRSPRSPSASRPTSRPLATISGVGCRKLGRFGESVLAILGGADPVEVAQNASAATKSEALRHALTTRPSNFTLNTLLALSRRCPSLTLRPAQRIRRPAGARDEQTRRVALMENITMTTTRRRSCVAFRAARRSAASASSQAPVVRSRGPLCPRSAPASAGSCPSVVARAPDVLRPRPSHQLQHHGCRAPSAPESHLSRATRHRSSPGRGTRHPGSAAFLFVRRRHARTARKTAPHELSCRHEPNSTAGRPTQGRARPRRHVTRTRRRTVTGTTEGGDTDAAQPHSIDLNEQAAQPPAPASRVGSTTPSCGSPRARPTSSSPSRCADTCPARHACLAGALDRPEPWGVWGGQLFVQGVVVARKRPRGRPRKNPVAA